MFKISLTECLIIGLITITCGIIIQYIVATWAEDDIKENNIFCLNKGKLWFWLTLFLIGVGIHLFVTTLDLSSWECQKVCVNDLCKIVCIIPINGLTNLLITR